MTSPNELIGLMDEWKNDRQMHEVVKDALEEVSRRYDLEAAKVVMLTEQVNHERDLKEQAQRRVAMLEAQLATIASTARDVGTTLARIIGATADQLTDVEAPTHEAEVEPEAFAADQPAPLDVDPIDIPLFLLRCAANDGLTASKLPEVRL